MINPILTVPSAASAEYPEDIPIAATIATAATTRDSPVP
jgi:hypothetical protein